MAITISNQITFMLPPNADVTPVGVTHGTINLGNPYAAGGIPIVAADIDPAATAINGIMCGGPSLDGTVTMVWDSAAGKIKAFDPTAAGAEHGAVDLSAISKTCYALFDWE